MERTLALLTVVYLAIGFGFVLVIDYWEGATTFPWFLTIGILMGALVGGIGWWLSRKRFVAMATLAIMLALIALRFVALSPVKAFRDFYRQLQPGMSEQAVLSALDRRFPAGGRFSVPVVHHSKAPEYEVVGFTLDPTDGRYNSEIVLAYFDEGSLTTSEYHPD